MSRTELEHDCCTLIFTPAADMATQHTAAQAMTQLNLAYEQLLAATQDTTAIQHGHPSVSDPGMAWAAAAPPHPGAAPSPSMTTEDSSALACTFCGCSPALDQTLRECVGMVVLFSWRTYDVRACRTCGVIVAEHALNATMIKGWWGFVAILANVWAIVANIAARHAFSALPAPPSAAQLVAAAPMTRRAGIWVTAAVAIWFVASLAATA